MDKEKKPYIHVLALSYPTQGHINPILQFCKRLASTGVKATLATTLSISKSMQSQPDSPVQIEAISDGYDDGFDPAHSIERYLAQLQAVGSKTLAELIIKYQKTQHPIDCIVYDSFLSWVLDVAEKFDLVGAVFFTQPCAVNYIYYYVYHGLLKLPVSSLPVQIPGMPVLDLLDLPSFIYVPEMYPAYIEMVLNQFSNADKADFVLVNTFYKLEDEIIDSMSKLCPLMTIGPTIPSIYLDKRVENDNDYGLSLFSIDQSTCINWLSTKPVGSVIYVSFGSMASLGEEQMEELGWGLKASNCYFIWVVRASEVEKLPKNFAKETVDKGLVVHWSPQLKVLANEAVGCFFTHCGWNSTLEALSLGVPMVGMPQWTDQTTNAKLIEDIWKVGVRVKVNDQKKGIVPREDIESCIREVMEGERGKEMKKNARKLKELAIEAVDEGGTSDKNINEFISKLVKSRAGSEYLHAQGKQGI